MHQIRHLLPQLYCFSVVARQRSFTLAADELSIAQSAVSYQIKKLEDQLGYTLLIREPRKPIQLTAKGRVLMQRCEEIYASLDHTLDELSGSSLSGELAVATDVCFGTQVVAPALPLIQQRYPKLGLRLNLSETFVELGGNEIDLAIRSRTDDPTLEYQFLCNTRMLLVASKSYLQSAPPLKNLKDLAQHRILCTGDDDYDWLTLVGNTPALEWQKLGDRLCINNIQALTQAMIAGSGVAYLAHYTLAQQLDTGVLEVLLPQQLPEQTINYYLAFPGHAKGNPRIRAFGEQLRSFISGSELSRFLQTDS